MHRKNMSQGSNPPVENDESMSVSTTMIMTDVIYWKKDDGNETDNDNDNDDFWGIMGK